MKFRHACQKVNLGEIEFTDAIFNAVESRQLSLGEISWNLAHHARGNWGIADERGIQANNQVCDSQEGSRLLSVYKLNNINYKRLWIITDDPFGTPVTTILLPDDC